MPSGLRRGRPGRDPPAPPPPPPSRSPPPPPSASSSSGDIGRGISPAPTAPVVAPGDPTSVGAGAPATPEVCNCSMAMGGGGPSALGCCGTAGGKARELGQRYGCGGLPRALRLELLQLHRGGRPERHRSTRPRSTRPPPLPVRQLSVRSLPGTRGVTSHVDWNSWTVVTCLKVRRGDVVAPVEDHVHLPVGRLRPRSAARRRW